MSSIALEIHSNEIADILTAVETLQGGITGDEILQVIGRAGFTVIKEHFEQLAGDEAHHQSAASLGAAPTGFYERAADNVQQPEVEPEGVSVSIDQQGLAQRLFGGDIAAKPGHWLTIPARAESYGKRAKEFDNLKFILFPSGLAALVDKDEKAHEGTVYYWLVRSVTQPPDPSVIPSEDEIFEPAVANARRYIERLWDERADA